MRGAVLASCAACATMAACGSLTGLGNYEDCAGAACNVAASVDASTMDVFTPEAEAGDGGRDALADTAAASDVVDSGAPEVSTACQTSVTCPTATPACSQGRCTGIATLVGGSADDQCVILLDGTLWCWGNNASGALGRGAVGGSYSQPAPVTVLPSGSTVAQAGTGFDYTCALTSNDHQVRCWGTGQAGSGNGSAVQVQLPADAVELSVGEANACARVIGNDVYCWGQDGYAQIGCGPNDAGPGAVSPLAPQLLIDSSKDIAHLAVGLQATCVVQSSSYNVYCFGSGQWGSLGGSSSTPLPCGQSMLTGFAANSIGSIVSSDYATCATDINNNIYCWGMNYAYFGAGVIDPNNSAQTFSTPYQLPLTFGPGAISIGWLHGCMLPGGNVYCWGASTHGETGIYSPSAAVPIRQVSGIGGPVLQMQAQRQFTCVLRMDGQVLCWGNNVGDLIGASVGTDTATPTAIAW